MRSQRFVLVALATVVGVVTTSLSARAARAAPQDATQQSAPPSAATSQSPATSDEKLCTLAGTVLSANTGEPLRRARIELEDEESDDTVAQVLSDAAGHFEMKGVPPGRYNLTVYRDGYREAQYGQMAHGGSAAVLALAPGQKMTELVFRLWKLAAISGRIIDSNGDPVQRIEVTAVQAKSGHTKSGNAFQVTAVTDDRGEYRIFDVRPGRYILTAIPPENRGLSEVHEREIAEFRQTYYPQTADITRATIIEAKSSDEVTGMDMALIPASDLRAYTVRGHVIDNTGGSKDTPFTVVILTPRSKAVLTRHDSRFAKVDEKTGEFELREVPPGEYSLTASIEGPNQQYRTTQNLTVVASDPENLTLVVSKGATLTAQITFEGKDAGSAPSIRVVLEPADSATDSGGYRNYYALRQNDGTYAFGGVTDGDYRLAISSNCENCFLKAADANGVDVLARGVQVNGGVGPGRIDMVYSSACGALTGSVKNGDDAPAVGATVVAIPQFGHLKPDRYDRAKTDQFGHFELTGLAPGRYKAFAFETADAETYGDPDAMRPLDDKGVTFEVGANEKKTVGLTMIPANDAAN